MREREKERNNYYNLKTDHMVNYKSIKKIDNIKFTFRKRKRERETF